MPAETVKPLSAFFSTNLNNKIESVTDLTDRIQYSLGYPMVQIEVATNQIREFVSIASEMFTKFAGFTSEYLAFDSRKYTSGQGMKLSELINLTAEMRSTTRGGKNASVSATIDTALSAVNTITIVASGLEYKSPVIKSITGSATFTAIAKVTDTIRNHVGGEIYSVTISNSGAGSYGPSVSTLDVNNFIISDLSAVSGGFDHDLEDYRKIVDVVSFDEGSTTGVNTLFTIEQTLAQQTYFSYSMGNYGFDLISWQVLKSWLETREKMLAIQRTFKFDPRTQLLMITPEPKNTNFYGVVTCYMERKFSDVIKEPWVYQYALALTKIAVGHVRGKFSGTQLFGGGSPNANDMMSQGIAEKEKLETKLYEGTAGFGDAPPPMFFVA